MLWLISLRVGKTPLLGHQVYWWLLATSSCKTNLSRLSMSYFFRLLLWHFLSEHFKGSFIEAHSSTLTASSSSPHRYLRSHNDYLTESWLNALFYWEGMYSSGNVGEENKAFIVETEWVASKGMRQHLLGHACRQMKNKQANRERILPYSALWLWWVAQHELLTCKRRWRWAKQWQRQVRA